MKNLQKVAKNYARVAVKREVLSDFITPILALKILRQKYERLFLFESVEQRRQWGRWSFIGIKPSLEISGKNGEISITKNGKSRKFKGNPIEKIREILKNNAAPKLPDMPAFTGGLVGYFAYDFIRYIEPKLDFQHEKNGDFKDFDLMLFDTIIAFDNLSQKLVLIANIKTKNFEKNYQKAQIRLEKIERFLKNGIKNGVKNSGRNTKFAALRLESPLAPAMKKSRFLGAISKIKRHIIDGDIFQAVLSAPFVAQARGSLLAAYRILRATNPSPYMFYLRSPSIELSGSSPETLVRLNSGIAHTFPIAGTRKLSADPKENAHMAAELLSDEKELSEHNMLVDLARNDMGKVAAFGSVAVEDYLKVQHYSHVMHITSAVSGRLAPGKDALDALCAILPAGTLSGAPKIRACEIINALEGAPRGIYGGAVGYLDFSGDMDLCIAIRFAYKMGARVVVQAGAGIVADSNAESEWQEVLNKSAALREALERASTLKDF